MKLVLNLTLFLASLNLTAQVLTPSLRIKPEDDGIIPKSSIHANNTTNAIDVPFIRFDDIMWSTRHWEKINVREKINHPLYYPLKELSDRKSLYAIITDAAIEEGRLDGFVFKDDMFMKPLSASELKTRMSIQNTYYVDGDPNLGIDTIVNIPIDPATVVEYKIKSDWYFDKQRGEMRAQIIAICPVIVDSEAFGDSKPRDLCWIFYPALRNVLASQVAYNPSNNSRRITFDQLFQMRYFNAVVYKQDNVFDRTIADYSNYDRMFQLLESQRIREELRDYEGSLWQF